MSETLLIYNERSGSFDPALLAEIERLFDQADRPIGRKAVLGEDALPTGRVAQMADMDLIIVLSGDGSINAIGAGLEGWSGTMLVLPGGTMNLLSRALHGDLPAVDIVRAFLAGTGKTVHPPLVCADHLTAYSGIMVGPTAAWASVREDLRNFDVAGLSGSVLRALTATLDKPCVRLADQEMLFSAIYVEPARDGLRAFGIQAENAGDLFRHGWAWLSGDFRDGPSEPIAATEKLDILSSDGALELLVDGEKHDVEGPLHVRAAQSGVAFYAARGRVVWD